MCAPRKKGMCLFYPKKWGKGFDEVDSKFGIPLRCFTGSDYLAYVLINDIGDFQSMSRCRREPMYEHVAIYKRMSDIKVVHEWYGECHLYDTPINTKR